MPPRPPAPIHKWYFALGFAPELSAAEIAVLEQWVKLGAPAPKESNVAATLNKILSYSRSSVCLRVQQLINIKHRETFFFN